ncbi:hypothetical protein PCLA_02f0057 [Pseudomonas citronellolis]|nr:hypothetical protein PCLA_02f0057 [Pseudomonas citronellolis]
MARKEKAGVTRQFLPVLSLRWCARPASLLRLGRGWLGPYSLRGSAGCFGVAGRFFPSP